jgi:hypothetical protein
MIRRKTRTVPCNYETIGDETMHVITRSRSVHRAPGSNNANATAKTKRPPGNWAASSSRENSSNGGKAVKTFFRNLMSPKTGVSSDFSEINVFVFSSLQN